ncbi:GtrA family protein [Kibdelosporangium philippinense]|uniref:GtrA family protein n=1 Tax=Kibdelosporangium philippinense TaxID=211113 RepID=A0ABS8Z3J8_9PSEU|nr:GtrA family protein [Kibdelosporangium philippinense]MCE7002506.1 GtrA family protein [Kibdelosporangium philippinense]
MRQALLAWLDKRAELLKFIMVGAICWVVDTGVVYTLKLTVLGEKPLTARVIGVVVATVASYALNREWSFRSRGGRQWHWEATLYLVCSGIGVLVTVLPQAVSLYVLQLRVPFVSPVTQAVANFITGQVIGVLLATGFRFWAFRRFVFPEVRTREPEPVG